MQSLACIAPAAKARESWVLSTIITTSLYAGPFVRRHWAAFDVVKPTDWMASLSLLHPVLASVICFLAGASLNESFREPAAWICLVLLVLACIVFILVRPHRRPHNFLVTIVILLASAAICLSNLGIIDASLEVFIGSVIWVWIAVIVTIVYFYLENTRWVKYFVSLRDSSSCSGPRQKSKKDRDEKQNSRNPLTFHEGDEVTSIDEQDVHPHNHAFFTPQNDLTASDYDRRVSTQLQPRAPPLAFGDDDVLEIDDDVDEGHQEFWYDDNSSKQKKSDDEKLKSIRQIALQQSQKRQREFRPEFSGEQMRSDVLVTSMMNDDGNDDDTLQPEPFWYDSSRDPKASDRDSKLRLIRKKQMEKSNRVGAEQPRSDVLVTSMAASKSDFYPKEKAVTAALFRHVKKKKVKLSPRKANTEEKTEGVDDVFVEKLDTSDDDK